MRAPRVDEAYRAASIGLQVGAGTVALLWMLQLLLPFGACACACPCGVFAAATALGALAALHVGAWRLPARGRGVLITGCDSGFGLALAQHLQRLGCTVFAGCLRAHGPSDQQSDGARTLRQLSGVHVLQLDVTDDKQVETARAYVEEHLPVKGLWGVVNNAGIFLCSPMEWLTVDDARLIFNVNTFGLLRVSKAFLPLLRRTRGRLVNVTSLSGRIYAGPMGAYCMSKHASNALSEGLRFEQRRFGVRVVTVEPGDYAAATSIQQMGAMKTSLAASWEKLSADARTAYGEGYADALLGAFVGAHANEAARSKDISPVVEALEAALLSRWPAPLYAPCDVNYSLRTWINTHCPEWIYEAIYV